VEKNRTLSGLIATRLQEPHPLIQVVVGPRQVGKTTAVQAALQGRGVYETADSPLPPPASVIAEWWARALAQADRILAIDEIQKIPGWSEVLKRLWDTTTPPLKVIVTGSSALLVEHGLHESLAGRFELLRAEHWHWAEAQAIFGVTLAQFVEFGCYPGSLRFLCGDDAPEPFAPPAIERWSAYVRDAIVEPAIGRDLLQLRPVEQPALLRQLFGVAVSLPAQVVTLHKLHGALQGRGTLPTLKTYLQLLQAAFLITGIEKYSSRPFRARQSSPKLIVHDNALLRAFERPVTAPLSPARFGHYFENAVGARFIEAGWDTFYWSERDKEVDFVVLGPLGEKWAVEVKTADVEERELKPLHSFCRLYSEFEPCLVSLSGQRIAGVRSLAAEDLLSLTRQRSQ
jgi:predicted AAA+ superfamily ATPase